MHTTHYSSFPLRKTLLALAIGAASQTAMAADAAAAKQPGEETLIVEANETSDFKSGGDLVVPAFLDGQIAHGGRLGMLGEQKAMDVPFNVIGYTSKLIQDQQAKTITDVVSNDAGVQPVQGYGNYAETYRIRGHFEGDPGKYKDPEEQKAWLAKDPIPRIEAKLIELGMATQADIDAMRAKVDEEIEAAKKFAEDSPEPGDDELLTDVLVG